VYVSLPDLIRQSMQRFGRMDAGAWVSEATPFFERLRPGMTIER